MFQATECKNVIRNFFAKGKYDKLKITKKAFLKVMMFANMAGKYEISGFGRIQDGVITDFKLIKQEIRNAYVEASSDAVMDFIRSVPKEELPEWELDWHSHVDMNAFASDTDVKNYEEMLTLKGGVQFPAMIVNKSGEIELFNFLSEKKMPKIELKMTNEEISAEEFDKLYEEAKAEVEKQCTVYVAPVVQNKLLEKSDKKGKKQNNKQTTIFNQNYNQNASYDEDAWYSYKNYGNGYSNSGRHYCKSCGLWLDTDEERERGICDDCMEVIEAQQIAAM